jgi:hypothetical protein
MFFRKKRSVELTVTTNTLKYFSQLHTLLQAASFTDGLFASPFIYFREHYFSLIDSEMSRMTQDEKLAHVEKDKVVLLQTLAALSRVLKAEVFKKYLEKMYSPEEQKDILQKIGEMPRQIPIEPINKIDRSGECQRDF